MGQPEPKQLRAAFTFELEQLRLQIEVMALKVDEALRNSTEVLATGSLERAEEVISADDDIDEMLVSLTERCYDLLARQNPVASDLRLVVSAIRILSDLERMGDLCIRIVKLAPEQRLISSCPETFSILLDMSSEARDLCRSAIKAWSTQDLRLARSLEARDDAMDAHNSKLMEAILALECPNAVPIAVSTLLAGRALERIADHAVMIGERLSYLLTGNTEALTKEISPAKRRFENH